MQHLKGKVALVTGAGKGIGRAVALKLASAGIHVILSSRTESDLMSLAREIQQVNHDVRALAFPADLSNEADVDRLATKAFMEFGQVDILVNNAGVGKYGTVAELTTADYDWMMNTNMRSTWLCTKAFMPPMLERQDGTIIFINSVTGMMGNPLQSLYSATKFAQMGFAQSIDYEAYPNNVKVSVIAPGGVNTHFGFESGTRIPDDPKLDRYLDADVVADAVLFAVAQPPKSRIFLLGIRAMSEALRKQIK